MNSQSYGFILWRYSNVPSYTIGKPKTIKDSKHFWQLLIYNVHISGADYGVLFGKKYLLRKKEKKKKNVEDKMAGKRETRKKLSNKLNRRWLYRLQRYLGWGAKKKKNSEPTRCDFTSPIFRNNIILFHDIQRFLDSFQ